MNAMRSRQQYVQRCLCLLLLFGCQPSNDRPYTVYPVDGQLYFARQPAAGATITFHPEEKDNPATSLQCTVRQDGHFVPIQADGAVGLPEGTYRLTAQWIDGSSDRFEGKYSNPEQPLERIKVGPTVNLLPPIQLN